jgi:dynactin complex subunit
MDEDQGTFSVGDRVVLLKFTDSPEYGVVRYIGNTSFAKGKWIGVECDSPGMICHKEYT